MDLKILGNRIANARKAQNMSQAQLAGLLFISPQAVGKWERGESIPDFMTINQLADIFAVGLDYFSGGTHVEKGRELPKLTYYNGDGTVAGMICDMEPTTEPELPLLTDFSGSALAGTDFVGVHAPKRKFLGSDLRNADFSNADLNGSSFKGSDLSGANFNETDLSGCKFSTNNLTKASFDKTILTDTEFYASELTKANFKEVSLINAKIACIDLKKAVFENCSFKGTTFKSCDMSGVNLDGQTFIDVMFDRVALTGASFQGATFRNVSFRSTSNFTNRYYKTLQTIRFDGAMMDKLTFAALKGLGVDLSLVKTL
jgi:uncharacterized protein YjbI with pentapeptide repeats